MKLKWPKLVSDGALMWTR